MKNSLVLFGSFALLTFSATASANWGARFHKAIVFPESSDSPFTKLSCDFYNSQNQANGLGQITAKQYVRKLDRSGQRVVWTNVMDLIIGISPVGGADALYNPEFVTIPKADSHMPKAVYSISYGEYQSPDIQTILLDENVTSRKNASPETDPLIAYIDSVCPF